MLKSKLLWTVILSVVALAAGCRYDMQDQPRYKPYKQSDFFPDKRASRDLPNGTVPRGQLRENKALYTGKKENADPNAQVQTTTDASGNTLISSFPNDIEEFPIPVTQELLDRGEERYKVYCIVCHGPVGNGDGMIVRRGFSKPPTYNDDRLRNAPVGHFYDVITNGQGRMNSYASQIPNVSDRWAIVAYIRALQISQNPNAQPLPMTNSNTNTAPRPAASPSPATSPAANTTTTGGAR
ncbi:MAG TPA: cytochrome c [Pyrinomonadaceae bacterium]|jgi:mono/diheme cytochrome c family protein